MNSRSVDWMSDGITAACAPNIKQYPTQSHLCSPIILRGIMKGVSQKEQHVWWKPYEL